MDQEKATEILKRLNFERSRAHEQFEFGIMACVTISYREIEKQENLNQFLELVLNRLCSFANTLENKASEVEDKVFELRMRVR